jgi:hypothetical protein
MLSPKDDFYNTFISHTISILEKLTFDHDDEAISHIFSLLATSIELLENMCFLTQNDNSRIGIPILLRSCLEATVDIQYLLKDKNNYSKLKLENLYLWKDIYEASYQDNAYVKHLKKATDFSAKARETGLAIRKLEKKGVARPSIQTKFKETDFLEEYCSIYAILCAHSHNGKFALGVRHLTPIGLSHSIDLFKSSKMVDFDSYLGVAVRLIALSIKSINDAFKYGLQADVDVTEDMINKRISYLNELGIE